MDVNYVQQSFGNGLIELETSIPELRALPPEEADLQIQQTKRILMDTQLRLSKASSSMAGIEKQINNTVDTEQQATNQQVITNLTSNIEGEAMSKNKKEIKAFNLKQAQFEAPAVPFGSDSFNDAPELGEENFNSIQEINQENGLDRKAFTDFLSGLASEDVNGLFQFVKTHSSSGSEEVVDKLTEQFNMIFENPMHVDESDQIAGQIYDLLDDEIKTIPSNAAMGIPTTISEINDIIKKLAEEHVNKKTKISSFNLKKTAQHKTVENVILHGPHNMKFDPFLRQPVSDWSILERNKGFGLTFDDVWDVDYEAIWRGSVMDKYSRPYRDKEGNWVGGYINKRFEVDRNIPETNNLQLKPGQLRRPTPPEYGLIESRLQAARANGDIEGGPDVNRSKPFNWKEASSKKKS
jgi:hypothetical protein